MNLEPMHKLSYIFNDNKNNKKNDNNKLIAVMFQTNFPLYFSSLYSTFSIITLTHYLLNFFFCRFFGT